MAILRRKPRGREKRVDTETIIVAEPQPFGGPGPSYVAPGYDDLGPSTVAGDPYAPVVGKDHLTHGQVTKNAFPGDSRPNPSKPPEEYWERRNSDFLARGRVEDLDGDGWNTQSDKPAWYDRPHPSDFPSNRTQTGTGAHPELMSFTRPEWGMNAVRLTGEHMSLADHRRDYPIGGMEPVIQRRNTYRVDPAPWDTRIIDMPSMQDETEFSPRIESVSTGPYERSFRLVE